MHAIRKYLYAIMYPNEGLVASQLPPGEFASSYAVGSARFYTGKMLFFELDTEFRHPYFHVGEYLDKTVEHRDGRPKRTKFISAYRVLEHLSFDAIRNLWAVSVSGRALSLERVTPPRSLETSHIRLYQLLAPTGMLYATRFGPVTFARYFTAEGYPKGAPTVFFTQYDLDTKRFSARWERNPYISSPICGLHPAKLKQVIDKLAAAGTVRSIGIQSTFQQTSYRQIKHGFWVGRGDELSFFQMPTESELLRSHEAWYSSIA